MGIVASFYKSGNKVELIEDDGLYYLESTPVSVSYGYEPTNDLDRAFDNFEEVVDYIIRRTDG